MSGEADAAFADAQSAGAFVGEPQGELGTFPLAKEMAAIETKTAAVAPLLSSTGLTEESLLVFRASAKRLKAARDEFDAATRAYGEAIRQLSDEAVK